MTSTNTTPTNKHMNHWMGTFSVPQYKSIAKSYWGRRNFINERAEHIHYLLNHGMPHKDNPNRDSLEYRAVRAIAYFTMGGRSPDRGTMPLTRAIDIIVGSAFHNNGHRNEVSLTRPMLHAILDQLFHMARVHDLLNQPYFATNAKTYLTVEIDYANDRRDARYDALEAAANAPVAKPVPQPKEKVTPERAMLLEQIKLLKEQNAMLRKG